MKQIKRTRAKTNLVTVLKPIAKEKGRAFIKYDASNKVGAAKLNADKLIAAADVLAAMHIASRGKAHTRSDIRGAMGDIFRENMESWKFEEKHEVDWVSTMTSRLMNMQRHMQQAGCKQNTGLVYTVARKSRRHAGGR